MQNDTFWFVILLVIAIGLFGGIKNFNQAGFSPLNIEQQSSPYYSDPKYDLEQKINNTQKEIDKLKESELAKNRSKYYGVAKLQFINKSNIPEQEYVVIKIDNNATTTVPITGWTMRTDTTGVNISIPKASYLFFAGMQNTEENIIMGPGETLYLVTGLSPNGASFKLNKCSGYLTQFQNFVPYINLECPLPREENLSSIPKSPNNYACLDHIESMPRCRIQTGALPQSWGYECTNFIYEELNYPSCVDNHKNDTDFYKKEWRVYLKRSDVLWNIKRESVTLYDESGKIVDSIKY